MNNEYISEEKLKKLNEELDFLKNVRRGELAENLQRARALGDLSENAEYHAAREEQGHSEDRIKEIEAILRTAVVVKKDSASKSTNEVVQIGSSVEIKKKGERTTKKIEIVGGEESDMLAGKVSFKSPLGEALFGERVGSEVTVATPKGEINYKIVSVS